MIASLDIVAKTFAKMFAKLSATIIAIKIRPILILHLESKFAKMKSMWKTKQGTLELQKSTLAKKSTINHGQSQKW